MEVKGELQALIISVDKQHQVFKEHLDAKNNERIIFSGIFGIGKSYFLNSFFNTHKEEYLAISLAPVNYSISNNEDIFKLIKYDILYELIMNHQLELVFEKVSMMVALGVMSPSKAKALFENLVTLIPFLNKETKDFTPLIQLINTALPILEEAQNVSKDVNLNSRIEAFVNDIGQGYLFEEDFITKFIEQSLDKLSGLEEDQKLKVLIIDDLDRIDPEHIFRLFNIFSSHLNYNNTSTNKFGFDKVIFVCDIDNIRNIFSNRYGADVDFTGYIDKFYSTDVFKFDNSEAVIAGLGTLIKSFHYSKEYTYFFENSLFRGTRGGALYLIIKDCVDNGSLSLRRIKSVYGNKYLFIEKMVHFPYSKFSIANYQIPAVIILEILRWIFGSIEALESALLKLIQFSKSKNYDTERDSEDLERLAGHFLPIVDFETHRFRANSEDTNNLKFEIDKGLKIKYKFIRDYNSNSYYSDITHQNMEDYVDPKLYLYEIIHQSFKLLKEIKYFK